jgi:Uma2 family endonuclease
MSFVSESAWEDWRPPPFPVRRFTVNEYHRMIETGVLTENDAVELLDGWIAPKMPRNPRHDVCIELANGALRTRLPSGWRVRVQSAITTSDSEPEPDLAVVQGAARDNLSRHPEPRETALVVESAESSLEYDRAVKGPLYARARIPHYWIINLVEGRVEAYSNPGGDGPAACYRERHDYGIGEVVPLVIGGEFRGEIPVPELLP